MISFSRLGKATLAICCLLVVSGCAQLQLSTAWALRDVDFMTLDPEVFRIALALPEGASFAEATVDLSFSRNEVALLDHKIDLDIVTAGKEVDRVGFPADVGSRFVFKLPQSRLAEVRNFQRQLVTERETPLGSSASFGLGSRLDPHWIKHYCAEGPRSLELSAWILVDDAQGYLPLVEDSQLGKLLGAQVGNICTPSH